MRRPASLLAVCLAAPAALQHHHAAAFAPGSSSVARTTLTKTCMTLVLHSQHQHHRCKRAGGGGELRQSCSGGVSGARRGRGRQQSALYMNMNMPREEPPDPDRYKRALRNSLMSVFLATVFGMGVTALKGTASGVEFFTGYIVEQSLSIDNLFVFLLLFEYYKVPIKYQGRVLRWGIIGAVVLRGVFIALGEAALESFQPVLLGFSAVLLVSAVKLFGEEEDGDEDLADNQIVQLSNRFLKGTDQYDGDRFFTMVEGVRRATPLLLVLVCVELSDLVFAVDSIPAVFGVTRDPFIVYTSNIFAILNLRALFTVLSNAVGDLRYLKPAVAIVLGFVGAKLGAEYFGYEVDTLLSLGIIMSILGGGVALSLADKESEGDEQQGA